MLNPSRQRYELLPRESSDDEQAFKASTAVPGSSNSSWLNRLSSRFHGVDKLSERAVYTHFVTPRRRKRSILRLVYWSVFAVPYILLFLVLFTGIFFPSYTVRPAHYNDLRQRAIRHGRANPHNETVFIAASLAEKKGDLTSGAWGKEVLQLVDLLGHENVHLSIYEDNPDPQTKRSLAAFREMVKCEAVCPLGTGRC
jgi:ZIP family zinc transporter